MTKNTIKAIEKRIKKTVKTSFSLVLITIRQALTASSAAASRNPAARQPLIGSV